MRIMFLSVIKEKLIKAERKHFINNNRRRLKNKTPSIISSTCNGGVIYSDLGLQFRSPTVNLWLEPKDFLIMCKDLKKYLNGPLRQKKSDLNYPVGTIYDITIYFQHYSNFDEAKMKWEERAKRVDYENLYVIMTDRDGCSESDICEFENLPIKNKVLFTHVNYPQYKHCCYIKGFEKDKQVGILSYYKTGNLIRRYIDDFDYVGFLNGGIRNQ